MSFFDKKEEVIDLVMTRRGREIFASGSFKPAYYDFFDDEVYYDPKFAPINANAGTAIISEGQNQIVDRIKQVPILKNQNDWRGSGDSVTQKKQIPFLFKPLGRSSKFTNYKPAWDIKIEEGVIVTDPTYTPLEDADSQEKIPQINVTCSYTVYKPQNKNQLWLKKSSDDFVIDIKELNVDDEKDNFTLEIFQYDWENNVVKDMNQLKFSDIEYGKEFAEYFFNITTDLDAEEAITINYVDDDSLLPETKKEKECKTTLSCAAQQIKALQTALGIAKNQAGPGMSQRSEDPGAPCYYNEDCKTGLLCDGPQQPVEVDSKTGKPTTSPGKCKAMEGGWGAGKSGPGAKAGDVTTDTKPSGANKCKYNNDCDPSECETGLAFCGAKSTSATKQKASNCYCWKPAELTTTKKCTKDNDCLGSVKCNLKIAGGPSVGICETPAFMNINTTHLATWEKGE
jgi:hypothetical protein